MAMAEDGLFEDLPEQRAGGPREIGGRPRLRVPVRDQVELRAVDLESLVAADHPVRVIWAYVEQLDLSELEMRIKAREGHPGHPPIAPRLLVALWLYATSEGWAAHGHWRGCARAMMRFVGWPEGSASTRTR